MTHDVIIALAALGLFGQVAVALLLVAFMLTAVGVRRPLAFIASSIWGYELWLAFVVSGTATVGSLFFSEIANFVPCELCWYQRICMYPLSLITLLAALANDHKVARYLLPLPVVGAGISIYHLLVENGVVTQRQRLPSLGPRRLRNEVDRRIRIRDDPHACPDGIRAGLRFPRVRRG